MANDILVVDDEADIRDLVAGILEDEGYVVRTAGNADDAIASIEAGEPYDLVCMDIMMTEMDGQQAVAEIRAMEVAAGVAPGKGTKIVMTTALGDMKNIMNAYGTLCDGYLVKPIRKDALAGELRKLKLIE